PGKLEAHVRERADAREVERCRIERTIRLLVVGSEYLAGQRVHAPAAHDGEPGHVDFGGADAGQLTPIDRYQAIAFDSEVLELRVAVHQRRWRGQHERR